MVLGLSRPADWTALSTLWQGVQADLGLPAPAIAVSGIDGYQLWFSLAEPVPVALACAFLESLRVRYLSSVASERVSMMPYIDGSMPQKIVHATTVPAQQQETGGWSAFVTSDLASIFADEPWLDRPPSPEAQANILARLECIKLIDFQGIIDRIKPLPPGGVAPVESDAVESLATKERQGVSGSSLQSKGLDPKQFLQDVMNDQSIDLRLRIDAAKALLPYSNTE
ncbi:MAG: hypothetical protein K9K38_13870 [Rhodoferax sp.]|nr:hypothetical protein [Rhodoferax sp.]